MLVCIVGYLRTCSTMLLEQHCGRMRKANTTRSLNMEEENFVHIAEKETY